MSAYTPAQRVSASRRPTTCHRVYQLGFPLTHSCQDFLQAHINLLSRTGRVWLVPTFKAAIAEETARNFVTSVFRDVRLPDVCAPSSASVPTTGRPFVPLVE